jgi:hypothetical protein
VLIEAEVKLDNPVDIRTAACDLKHREVLGASISYPVVTLTSAGGGCILSPAIEVETDVAMNAPVAEWYTRQVEGLCPKGRGGSSPLGGTSITARRAQELPAVSSRASRCFRAGG